MPVVIPSCNQRRNFQVEIGEVGEIGKLGKNFRSEIYNYLIYELQFRTRFGISNTSPLLNLEIINHLFLIKKQLGTILIPHGVLTELKINDNLPGSQQLQILKIKLGRKPYAPTNNPTFGFCTDVSPTRLFTLR